MKPKYRLYDRVTGSIFEFKTKYNMLIQIECFKEDYSNVSFNQLSEYEYEVSYYD